MNSTLLAEIRQTLKSRVLEENRSLHEHFFKEEVKYYGIKSAQIRAISKEFFAAANSSGKESLLELCEELMKSTYLEECVIACDWAYRIRKSYRPEDFKIFDRWVKNYLSNWAACDTLCNHTVAEFVTAFPQFLPNIIDWANSPNRWVRRASAVTFILPARKGKFHDIIFKVADILLTDNDDMVRKGYGWMLKSASQFDQKSVFDYVIKNKTNMPRTSLRYAIEKMPPQMRAEAMGR